LAGLERAARLAGESFGHEDLAPLQGMPFAGIQSSRWLWWLAAALAAAAGLAALSLR
jgi:predicted cobalt transporter CbtA